MNALATLQNFNLADSMSQDAYASMMASFEQADQSLGGGDLTTLSFKGRSFYLNHAGNTAELQTRNLDVYIVGIRHCDHVSFYEKSFEEQAGELNPETTITRDILPTDPKTKDWLLGNRIENGKKYASRARKRRLVLLLADDKDQRLVMADIGELSVYAPKQTELGLFSLSQLMKQFNAIRKHNEQAVPFLFKMQMSFTSDSVPVVQFSFQDQMNRDPNVPFRLADQTAIERAKRAWADGEVQRLLDLWINSPATEGGENTSQTAPTAPPVVPPTAPQATSPVVPPPTVPSSDDDMDEL